MSFFYAGGWRGCRHPGRRGALSCHTCSLYGRTWIEMPASFVVTFCRCGPCFSRQVRSLLIVIAAGVSVSAETRKPIYSIRRYCKATSEYSPIRSIGLTLVLMFPLLLQTDASAALLLLLATSNVFLVMFLVSCYVTDFFSIFTCWYLPRHYQIFER